MFERIKETLRTILVEMSTLDSDKGKIVFDAEALGVGVEVKDENDTPLADGEYKVEDKTIVVEDGKVKEIREDEDIEIVDEEAEEEVVDETTEETTEEVVVDEEPTEMEKVWREIETIKSDIEAIKNKLDELANTPAAETIVEEFNRVERVADTKLEKALAYARALKK